MNEEEKLLKIKEVMSRHKGHDHAITSKELMEILGVKEDATHSHTRALLLKAAIKYGIPIGATNKKPVGYFIIATQEELDTYIGALDRRKMMMETRKKVVWENYWNLYGPNVEEDVEAEEEDD